MRACHGVKGLSHLADLARRSYRPTGAQIWRFSGVGTSTAAQRYHIAKNGSTSSGHRQNIGEKISNGRRRYSFLNMLKNFCRCAAGASNGTTTAVLRYGFVNVGRASVAPRNGSAALRWPQCVPVSLRYSSGQRWHIGRTTAAPRYNIGGASVRLIMPRSHIPVSQGDCTRLARLV